jgi:C_GCAxxG_C_C family probable redox protein
MAKTNSRHEQAIALFRNNYNCAQSVFSFFAKELGIDEIEARRIAAGFGGGMGALQKTCGAVTGGIMALGAKFFNEQDIPTAKNLTYKEVRELIHRFEAKHGSVECRPLLGADITTAEGLKAARDGNLFHLKCEPLVLDVCSIVDELFQES